MAGPTVEVRSATGDALRSVALDEGIFGVTPNVAVMHQVVTAQLAAARAGTQSTKTRAEVSGGGRKPFKQKGTGRARQGSERAPQFTGGGVAFGPKPRSYRQRTPRKMVQLALRSALSDRASEGRVAVVDSWGLDQPSTKAALAALAALEVTGKILVVIDREDDATVKSFRNLPSVHTISVGELNTYDVLRSDWVIFTEATLPGDALAGATPVAAPTTTAPITTAPTSAAEPEPEPDNEHGPVDVDEPEPVDVTEPVVEATEEDRP